MHSEIVIPLRTARIWQDSEWEVFTPLSFSNHFVGAEPASIYFMRPKLALSSGT